MRLETPLIEMTASPMPSIEPDSVRRLQPADRGTQIGAWSLYQQMIVVGHQAVRVDYHLEPIMGFLDSFQKPLPTLIIAVDRPRLVASRRCFAPEGR